MLKDRVFTLPSPHASDGQQAAAKALEWCRDPDNHTTVVSFAGDLTSSLTGCMQHKCGSQKEMREKMWGRYHQLRTTEDFSRRWKHFLLQATGAPVSPIVFQYLTDKIFRRLICDHFPTPVEKQAGSTSQQRLSYEEQNAMRYAAGYIPRALRKRLERSSHPLKEELVLCLLDLTEDEDGSHESEDWIKRIDRGGLKHVTHLMFTTLAAMETELRSHLGKVPGNFKATVTSAILKNEDVLFLWSMVAAEWEEEESKLLLQMIVDLWVTIRGFSYASAWVEKYKLVNKRTVQKSKGVRKGLVSTKNSTAKDD